MWIYKIKIDKQQDPFLTHLWLLLYPSEAKTILAFKQFLFSVIYPIMHQCSLSGEGFMVMARWSPCCSGCWCVPRRVLLRCEALGIPQPPLLQGSSSDHFDAHRNLTMAEKYRSLLVWTNNFLCLISVCVSVVSSCRFYLQFWGLLSLCSFAFSYHI